MEVSELRELQSFNKLSDEEKEILEEYGLRRIIKVLEENEFSFSQKVFSNFCFFIKNNLCSEYNFLGMISRGNLLFHDLSSKDKIEALKAMNAKNFYNRDKGNEDTNFLIETGNYDLIRKFLGVDKVSRSYLSVLNKKLKEKLKSIWHEDFSDLYTKHENEFTIHEIIIFFGEENLEEALENYRTKIHNERFISRTEEGELTEDNHVACKLCGRYYKTLVPHIINEHRIEVEDYKSRTGHQDIICNSTKGKVSSSISFSMSKEGFKENYGEAIGTKKYKEYRKNLKGANTLERYIEKHGEEEGRKRFEKLEYTRSFSQTLEGFKEKYGEEEGERRYDERSKKQGYVQTLEGYQERYGKVKGKRLYKERKAREKFSNSLDGHIERFGEEEGRKRYERKIEKMSFASSLDGYIERYGKEEGEKKFKEAHKYFKLGIRYSKKSQEIFQAAIKGFDDEGAEFLFGEEELLIGIEKTDREKYFLTGKRFIKVDFTCSYKGKCLFCEFTGNYWHSFEGREEDDKLRYEFLKTKGEFVEITETEYHENFDKAVSKLRKKLEKFLKSV